MEPVIAGSIFVNPNLERGALATMGQHNGPLAIATTPFNLLLNKLCFVKLI